MSQTYVDKDNQLITLKTSSTHLCVANYLQAIGMKNSTKSLIKFVKLVNLLGGPVVPENTVRQDQVICRVEGSPVSRQK